MLRLQWLQRLCPRRFLRWKLRRLPKEIIQKAKASAFAFLLIIP